MNPLSTPRVSGRVRGWHAIAAACTLLAAAPVWAYSGASASVGPLRIELVDLRPEDTLAPSITFSVDGDEAGIAAVAGETWPPEVYQHARYGSWQGNALEGQTRHASASAAVSGGSAHGPAGTRVHLEGKAIDFVGPDDVSALYGAVFALNQGTNPMFELSPWTALVFSFDVAVELTTSNANDLAQTMFGIQIDDQLGNFLSDEFAFDCAGACSKSESRTLSLTFRNEADVATFASWTAYGNVTGTSYASAVPEPGSAALLLAGFCAIGGAVRRRTRRG